MSKLFKLKQWLTTEETAKHLSNVLAEPVSEADVLKLGLDGHLRLSVNFANSVPAKKGNVIPLDEGSSHKYQNIFNLFGEEGISDNLKNKIYQKTQNAIKKYPNDSYAQFKIIASEYDVTIGHVMEIADIDILDGISIGSGLVLELDDSINNIEGVFDLPMIGSELIDVSWRFHLDALGIEVDGVNLNGTFVSASDNIIYQTQESFDDNRGYKTARDRQQYKLRKLQFNKSTNRRKDKLIALRQEKFEKLDEKWNRWCREDRYYPAGKLPDDSILVVRTTVITDFLNTLDIEAEPEHHHNAKPVVKRANDFNSCLSEMITRFIERNDYPPTPDIILHELKHKPPADHIINFSGNELSIDGAKPKKLDNVKRSIKSLLATS